MKVSVIVTTYNRAHLVRETIDSILNQTFKDFELIVVDNFSSDNTEEVVKAYNDKRIRYFKHQNNGVVAVNRNYGISQARGEYIAFCDDDDVWLPEKLERQMLEFEKDTQVGLVCTNLIIFDSHGERRALFRARDSDLTFDSLIWKNPILCSSTLVKRQVIEDVGVMDENPEIFTAEDYELWLRIAKKYKVRYIGLPLVRYRDHAGAYRYTKKHSELTKAIYTRLFDKGLLDFALYQKLLHRLEHPTLTGRVTRLLESLERLKYIAPLLRLFRSLVRVGR